MSELRTWYDVLGVARSASAAEIRAAHRTAARTAHPDAGGSTARFQLVQQAYETLADPVRRAAYDRQLGGRPAPGPAATPASAARSAPAPSARPGPTPAPAARPTRGPSPTTSPMAPPPAPTGCLSPWLAIGGAVALVVATLVTIATLSSPSTTTSSPASTRPPTNRPPGTAAGTTTSTGAPTAGGPVTTVVLDDLPDGFPRGHVPLPAAARLGDVVVAAPPGGPTVFTVQASAPGTDPARAAQNYASTLQATGWTAVADPDPADQGDGGGDAASGSFTDADGAQLQFTFSEAADGGLDVLIGFRPALR